jgi:hypothetical protein
MTLSPNMTEKHLKDVFKALPEEMDEGELCALTLTIHSAFLDKPQDIITNLITTIYTFGLSEGLPTAAISEGLRVAAQIHDEEHSMKRAH